MVRGAPSALDLRPQAGLDNHSCRHLLCEGRQEAGKRLRRTLGAGRNSKVVVAAEARSNRQRGPYTFGGEDVTVGVGVPPKLDLLGHRTTLATTAGSINPVETMIGIAVLIVALGIAWVCFAVGVYYLTRTGREGMRIARMADERQEHLSHER